MSEYVSFCGEDADFTPVLYAYWQRKPLALYRNRSWKKSASATSVFPTKR
jgi:hypothetical protein